MIWEIRGIRGLFGLRSVAKPWEALSSSLAKQGHHFARSERHLASRASDFGKGSQFGVYVGYTSNWLDWFINQLRTWGAPPCSYGQWMNMAYCR